MALPPDQAAHHKQQIERYLRDTTKLTHERQKNALLYILQNEIHHGSQFMHGDDGLLYIRLSLNDTIVKLPKLGHGGDQIWAYLDQAYGLIETDTSSKVIYNRLRNYALNNGTKVKLRRFSAYDTQTHTAYLSNYDGQMWRIDGGAPHLTNNGDDDVFFADDDRGIAPASVDYGPHGILLDMLCSLNYTEGLGGITAEQQRMALTVWLFALALPDFLPTKPVLLIEGTQGSGKCLKKGTKVIMFDGTVRAVEYVRVGERLMGPDGNPRTVLATTTGHGPLYRITPVKGEPWVCNDAHVLSLACSDDEVVRDIPVQEFASFQPWRQNRFKQFSVGIDRFDYEVAPPIDPYFLGVWFGDGAKTLSPNECGIATVKITTPDLEIKELCEKTAQQWGLYVSTSVDGMIYGLSSAVYHQNPLLKTLRALVGPEIKVPESYMRGSRATRLQLLAGFLDTDGDLSLNCFNISQKREDWARAVWWLARSVGLCAVMSTRIGRCPRADGTMFEGTYWRVSISGDTDMIPTRIQRKQAMPRQQIKQATRTGITLEAIGDGDYAGFTLDGDHRFLLEDFTVTHNSAACQLIQFALLGHSKPMIMQKNKEDDFGVILLRSPIAVFDNTDSYIEWVPDAICAYATSGTWAKRKLYSDSDELILKPHAFIAVASKNPASFRREDTADRLIILRLERREGFRPFRRLEQEILDNRPQLFGEYLWYINQIVHELRVYGDQEQLEVTRMADFAALARAVGQVMHWDQAEIVQMLASLTGERDAFINEEDPLVDLINEWLSYKTKGQPSNVYREISLSKLHIELTSFAQAAGITTFCKTPRALGQKLRSPHIERDFHVSVHTHGGKKFWRFARKTDTKLDILDGDDDSPAPTEPESNAHLHVVEDEET